MDFRAFIYVAFAFGGFRFKVQGLGCWDQGVEWQGLSGSRKASNATRH